MDVTIQSLDDDDVSIRTHYLDIGDPSDPVIVLLHGAFASSHTFIPWADMLVENDYRVIAIDLPYHGLSGAFDDHITSLRRSAAVVKVVLETLEINRFVIGGNSMGGGVSWYFAGMYDALFDIEGLLLISPVGPLSGGGMRGGLLSNPAIATIASQMTTKFLLKAILEGVYGSTSTLQDATVTRYYELIRKEGFRYGLLTNTQENLDGVLEPLSLFESIEALDIPTLILWGIEDSWIPYTLSELFISTWDLELDDVIIYDGIGHVAMEENPTLTLIDLLDFLNTLAP
jgi:pimeloyl-ACP methyl ester carboxylesterase